jgi:adenylate cyclase class IV
MIEVEKKFLLTPEDEARLIDGAELAGEKSIEDTYYDTADYELTLANMWLRLRGSDFELKVPLRVSDDRTVDQYRELTDRTEICQALGLSADGTDVAMVLKNAQYEPFMSPLTTRRTYRKAGFTIDLDTVTYQNSHFRYAIAEIEKLVDKEADMQTAIDEIIGFARQHGLTTDQFILGKVGAFIKSERSDHYEALVAVGVL